MHDAADCVRPIDGRSAVRYDLDALERAERNERHVGEIPEAARCQAPAVAQYQRGFRTKATEIDAGTVGNVVLALVACQIGRAWGRESVCWYVRHAVVAV